MTSLGSVGAGIGTGTANALTFTKNIPAGAVVVVFGAVNTNTSVTAAADDKGNTWSAAVTPNPGAPICKGYAIWSRLDTAIAAGDQLDITLANSTSKHAIVAAAWSGLLSSPVDKGPVSAAGSSATASPGSSGTLAQADEVVVAAFATNQLAADTISLPGWTLVEQEATTSGSNDRRASLYELTVADTAAVAPAASLSSATTWGALLLTLKLDSGGPPPTGPGWSVLDGDGTTRLPATLLGIWDGSAIQPATFKEITS